MEVVSQELVTEFTNIGLGIGFTIFDLAKKNYNNLKELKINKDIPKINVYLGTNKSISPTFASSTFIKYLKRWSKKSSFTYLSNIFRPIYFGC